MNQISPLHSPEPSAYRTANHGPRIAVISSSWHQDIVANATNAIQAEFDRSRLPENCVKYFEVPGAFEIPLFAKRISQRGGYDAIIACGFVVNGGIYRHEFVASAVIDGLMQVQLECGTPIFSSVLTPRDFHESEEHHEFFRTHFRKKGTEVARTCLDSLVSLQALARGDD